MSKHSAKKEKVLRNELYAVKYRQLKCKKCGHRTSVSGRCVICGDRIVRTSQETAERNSKLLRRWERRGT